jgi:hypothetical protein
LIATILVARTPVAEFSFLIVKQAEADSDLRSDQQLCYSVRCRFNVH